MTKKRILIAAIALPCLLAVGAALLVRSWTITPHGRLDPRVAIFLKLTGADEKNAGELRLTVAESRKRLAEKAASVSGTPVEMSSVKDMTAEAGGVHVPVRVYFPREGKSLPAVIFFHGGGWVQGSVDTHDGLCRIIAKKSGAAVISVEYRLAPEHPYPAAIKDAYAALLWLRANGTSMNIDPKRIAVAGDSAGGNLAAALCLMARDRKGPSIVFQALIYPGLNAAFLDTESYGNFGRGYMLDKTNVERFIGMYLPDRRTRTDPYASPLLARDHRNLPAALVITAEFDVLRDEGEAYAGKLADAGVPARAIRYPGMIHGFVSADRILPQARRATDEIASALVQAFADTIPLKGETP